ncbi:hypothetical protein PIB30_062856 [Stylosanthes scabra]|uniref:RRM domain-containing protein n=1 Tax=Stylosanthes scabra TaxID=79078 RepID=A0ABU6ZK24_9FABA|nr:hypothetical protein [Stylosanthes scabra]
MKSDDCNEGEWKVQRRRRLPRQQAKDTSIAKTGRGGSVVDVFIPRKRRKGNPMIFAFVRFDSKGGAERAVRNLDGVFVGSKRMSVSLAKYHRPRAGNMVGDREGRSRALTGFDGKKEDDVRDEKTVNRNKETTVE